MAAKDTATPQMYRHTTFAQTESITMADQVHTHTHTHTEENVIFLYEIVAVTCQQFSTVGTGNKQTGI